MASKSRALQQGGALPGPEPSINLTILSVHIVVRLLSYFQSNMSLPPATPDCILLLRDGTSIATTSGRLHGLLARYSSHQPAGLPVYTLKEASAAVKLLHSICVDEVDPLVGDMPPIASILQLAQLCTETGYTGLFKSHVIPWTRRSMLSSIHTPHPDMLRIALVCKDRRAFMDIFRVFVLVKLTRNELRTADTLVSGLPNELCISAIRARLRRDLRTLLLLPIADHPSLLRPRDAEHECVTQALDLVAYINVLSQASLFPLSEDDGEICLVWMGRRLEAAADNMPYRSPCRDCGSECSPWRDKFEAIEESLGTLLQSLLTAVDACLFDPPNSHMAQMPNSF